MSRSPSTGLLTSRHDGPMTDSIRPFYADWAGYHGRLVNGLHDRPAADLGLRVPGSDHWPVWAVVAHVAGTRVYWLCHVFGEPGAESTPFSDASGAGWEDDLERPRSGAELVEALTATWRIVERTLDRWTPAMLGEAVERQRGSVAQRHTRQSVLLRMIYHEAYHVGEINLAFGAHGRETIDPWRPADWAAGAPVELREG